MGFLPSINILLQLLDINTTSSVEASSSHLISVRKSSLKTSEYMETQLRNSYNFLSNLEIISYYCTQKQFFIYEIIGLRNDEFFLKIGVLPEYLTYENFRDIVHIQKFTVFDSTDKIEIVSSNEVYLMALGEYMGFKISKDVKYKLEQAIVERIFFKKLEVKIQINSQIEEFIILEIKLFVDGTIIISTDTVSLNNGLFLDYFRISSKISNNKHFLAFIIYTINQINYKKFKMKSSSKRKKYIFDSGTFPPMFMLLHSFQKKLKLIYIKPEYAEIYFKFKKRRLRHKSHSARFIIQVHTSNMSGLDIKKFMHLEDFDEDSFESEGYKTSYIKRKTFIKIKKAENNIWNIILDIPIWNYDCSKKNIITFLFKKNKKTTVEFESTFNLVEVNSTDEITVSLTIENPSKNVLNILKKLEEIIHRRDGNIVFNFSQENCMRNTYVICFDKGNANFLVLRELHKFPIILLPSIFS